MHGRFGQRRLVFTLLCAVALLVAACGSGSSIAPGFPTNATHPQPVDRTFQGCPPQGDGGDAQLNVLKNRIDDGDKGTYSDVDLSTLIGLPYPSDIARAQRRNWSSADADAVAQYEGAPVRTIGYIAGVRHEGTESPNCHSTDFRDFHVWLVPSPNDDRSKSMVVEVAPRVRDARRGWSDAALSGLVGQRVRISGWLMMDQEHPEQIGQTRATLWEIHPILHIEVASGGGFSSIDG